MRCDLCGVEALEQRRLLSAAMDGSVLNVAGTAGDDRIIVTTRVTSRYEEMIVVLVNGKGSEFPWSGVSQVRVDARAGNDTVSIGDFVYSPAKIYGGAGDDSLLGG